jgi:hypothetical protein
LKIRLPIKRHHSTENTQRRKRFDRKTYTPGLLLPENCPKNNHENYYPDTEDQ